MWTTELSLLLASFLIYVLYPGTQTAFPGRFIFKERLQPFSPTIGINLAEGRVRSGWSHDIVKQVSKCLRLFGTSLDQCFEKLDELLSMPFAVVR
jgi:hypothetical protein